MQKHYGNLNNLLDAFNASFRTCFKLQKQMSLNEGYKFKEKKERTPNSY